MIIDRREIIFILIFGILFILLIWGVKFDFDNPYSDPEPNQEYFKEVVDYIGREPCCDQTWFEMCMQYQEENNVSFECFT